jgi:hypothetical protein
LDRGYIVGLDKGYKVRLDRGYIVGLDSEYKVGFGQGMYGVGDGSAGRGEVCEAEERLF